MPTTATPFPLVTFVAWTPGVSRAALKLAQAHASLIELPSDHSALSATLDYYADGRPVNYDDDDERLLMPAITVEVEFPR